jgi:hypothetical protein
MLFLDTQNLVGLTCESVAGSGHVVASSRSDIPGDPEVFLTGAKYIPFMRLHVQVQTSRDTKSRMSLKPTEAACPTPQVSEPISMNAICVLRAFLHLLHCIVTTCDVPLSSAF